MASESAARHKPVTGNPQPVGRIKLDPIYVERTLRDLRRKP